MPAVSIGHIRNGLRKMTSSPYRNAPHFPPTSTGLPPSSPRTAGRLRKLQSQPSLISQQRHQQLRNASPSRNPAIPALPAFSTPRKHTRTRSNSDMVATSSPNTGPSTQRAQISRRTENPKDELKSLMRRGPRGDLPNALQSLRHWILVDGLEADHDGMVRSYSCSMKQPANQIGQSDLRIYVWLIMLNSPPLSTDVYLELIRRGPSPAYAKIRNDTHRTLMTNPLFKRRVRENSIIRLLNAIAWRLHDAKSDRMTDSGRITNASTDFGSPELQHVEPVKKHAKGASTVTGDGSEAGGSEPGIYVQGMNVLCAPFLYAARTEPQAFIAFHYFITRECPGYIRGAMDGVHKGVALVERCLAIADQKLSTHLLSKGVKAQIYAFASVLTMSACTPPLPEVLQLWDFLFAFGSHLNILCICAQLMMMREDLLADSR